MLYLVGRVKEGESLWSVDGKASEMVSQERLSFLGLRSKKAGLMGLSTISTLHVNMATISDIGGLRLA